MEGVQHLATRRDWRPRCFWSEFVLEVKALGNLADVDPYDSFLCQSNLRGNEYRILLGEFDLICAMYWLKIVLSYPIKETLYLYLIFIIFTMHVWFSPALIAVWKKFQRIWKQLKQNRCGKNRRGITMRVRYLPTLLKECF